MSSGCASPRRFFSLLLLGLCAGSLAAHAIGVFRNTSGCDLRSILPAEYMAYCENERFADYEHGAFWYDLEPGVVQAMRDADVLFVGNSRLQLGFDPSLLAAAMSELGLRYYMLGFGYKEYHVFAQSLIERYRLKPRALVANADPFFVDALSAASRPLLEAGPGEPMLGYRYRGFVQRAKARLCGQGAPLASSRACEGFRLTIYRNRQSGEWRLARSMGEGSPIVPMARRAAAADVSSASAHGRFLRERLGLSPTCLPVLGVPTPSVSSDMAARIASKAGLPFIEGDGEGLRSSDGSHLTSTSATAWTLNILPQLTRVLAACMQSK